MRTARALGYRTVAVFSDADAHAPHVMQADAAVHIGAAPASASYLNVEALLRAAQATGADAVHPGYGFLSERAEFAEACAAAGLVFIGPPPAAMRAMGHKALAKRRMQAAGVPCAPGYFGDDQSDAVLTSQAHALGVPLLVKAVAGGGGRGMRLVRDMAQLPDALAGARREAQSSFGDATLMLERLIEGGRHIEIQVFADGHGHAVHLGERDCTAQRRRQKVIEEAPSPIVSAALRDTLGRDAVAAALAVGYQGAGTVEFIVDAQLRHYFLEMNARLQVEHPVTECITGLDLVEWQLRVAAGEPLPLRQEDIRFHGHAIEARLYAEDPYDGFKPQSGRILHWRPDAALRSGVRIDHGIAEGDEVSPYYDPMLAKIIVHGRDRTDAIRRLTAALEDAPLLGLVNNGRYLRDLVNHQRFVAATMHTTLLDEWAAAQAGPSIAPVPDDQTWLLAANLRAGSGAARPDSVASFNLTLSCLGTTRTQRAPDARLHINSVEDRLVHYTFAGVHHRALAVAVITAGVEVLHIVRDGAIFSFTEASPFPGLAPQVDASRAVAPLAGVVAQVAVVPGQSVIDGQPLICVEAMKMETWVYAAAVGTVRAVHVTKGQQVVSGAVIVELELAIS